VWAVFAHGELKLRNFLEEGQLREGRGVAASALEEARAHALKNSTSH